jgi:hypothetical protein
MALTKYESYEYVNPLELTYLDIKTGGQDGGQTILTTSAHRVDYCMAYARLNANDDVGTLNFGWYATTAGQPSGSPLGSGTFDISSMTTSFGWVQLDFDAPFMVSNATLYCFVCFGVGITSPDAFHYGLILLGSTPYAAGESVQRTQAAIDDPITGFADVLPGQADQPFQVWGDTDPISSPPTPNPATFSTPPTAISGSEISMVATVGTTDDPPVEYKFTETSGNPGGATRDWDTSNSYTNTGLDDETEYTYTVTMRDANLLEGDASSPASATTPKTSVDLAPYRTNRRSLMVCNNVVWYEDI